MMGVDTYAGAGYDKYNYFIEVSGIMGWRKIDDYYDMADIEMEAFTLVGLLIAGPLYWIGLSVLDP